MRTVFIFGAGASRAAGGPLMEDFLDSAYDLLREGRVEDVRKDFEEVFGAISDLQRIYSKAHLDLDNLDVVFGAIEMAGVVGRIANRRGPAIAKLRDSLVTLIYTTLEQRIPFHVAQKSASKQVIPPPPYDNFVKILQDSPDRRFRDPHQYSFITFNYDLCLDYALGFFGKRYDYCLSNDRDPNASPLMKLHGSVNWGLTEDGEIIPHLLSDVHFNLMLETKSVLFTMSALREESRSEKPVQAAPVIVPPTWNKEAYSGQLANVWTAAADELSKAENIFVIGYSLPETDSFFRYLYALGSDGESRLRNFVVMNPDEAVEGRFRELIGRGIENRFEYFRKTFANGIPDIERILRSV